MASPRGLRRSALFAGLLVLCLGVGAAAQAPAPGSRDPLTGVRSRLSRDWVGLRPEPADVAILVMAGHADSQGIAGAGTGGAAVDLQGARPMLPGIRDELYWNLAVARRVVQLGLQRGLNIRLYEPPVAPSSMAMIPAPTGAWARPTRQPGATRWRSTSTPMAPMAWVLE